MIKPYKICVIEEQNNQTTDQKETKEDDAMNFQDAGGS